MEGWFPPTDKLTLKPIYICTDIYIRGYIYIYIVKDRIVKPVFSHCKREIYKPITNSMNNSGHLLQNIHIAE